jgi:outer membrane receptor for ferric coprogen and ferric-rhodotorulic acid
MLNKISKRIAGVFVASLVAGTLHAQSRLPFDLPSQPLAASLRNVATQAGVNVLFDPPLVEGRQARAIKGDLTADQAFTQLLDGTGLKYRHLDENTITVLGPSQVSVARSADQNTDGNTTDTGGGKASSQDFRVAQVAQAGAGPK